MCVIVFHVYGSMWFVKSLCNNKIKIVFAKKTLFFVVVVVHVSKIEISIEFLWSNKLK